jgi:hypothetical protein
MNTLQFQLGGTLKFLIDEPASRPGARITIRYDGLTLTAWGDGMAYKLPNDKMIAVQVAYVDSKGNPAEVDGEVTWSTSDPNLATVATNAADSTQATVTPAGEPQPIA